MPQQSQRNQEIEKILRGAGIHRGSWARSAQFSARAPSVEDEFFEWILTTEKPTVIFDWERWEFVEEVLLADGMLVPATGQVPLLDSHNRHRCGDVLGHVEQFAEAEVGGFAARTGRIFFAADQYSRDTRQKVVDSHLTDGSVGYSQNKSIWVPEDHEVTVKGRTFVGPVRVTYEWGLKEFSPTPIGADVLAKVRLLCGA
jgi:hypothetical protein